jgi:hypothetical protein
MWKEAVVVSVDVSSQRCSGNTEEEDERHSSVDRDVKNEQNSGALSTGLRH